MLTNNECKKQQRIMDELYAQIERNNEAFAKLPPEEKRRAVARDVILSMNTKQYVPTTGQYLHTAAGSQEEVVGGEQCEVCAIGATFVSAFKLGDRFQVEEEEFYDYNTCRTYYKLQLSSTDSDQMRDHLRENAGFSPQVLGEMEAVFEDDWSFMNIAEDDDDTADGAHTAEAFVQSWNDVCRSDKETLRAIMENILVHGDFRIGVPPVRKNRRCVTPGFEDSMLKGFGGTR